MDTMVVEASQAGHKPSGRKEYRDEQLFARLIGAAVLLAIAVIVLPFVLDGSGTQREYEYAETLPVEPPEPVVEKSFSSRQPLAPAPAIETVVVEVPQTTPLTGLDSGVVAVRQAQPAQSQGTQNQARPNQAPAAAVPVPSGSYSAELQNGPLKAGWNIQVASFVREANALKLLRRLRAQNLPAYSNTVRGSSRSLIRVLVGPFPNQIDALALQNSIDRGYRVESLMIQGK